MKSSYCGRFAPSPTGPLHHGSLVAALASWLDARAHFGKWLIRIEDIDPPRQRPGIAAEQIDVLRQLGMTSDEPVLYQSTRSAAYDVAMHQLCQIQRTFVCSCSRAQLALSDKTSSLRYPGTCRQRGLSGKGAIRFRVDDGTIGFRDRACGYFAQNVEECVGDFVIRRADGLWAYQLAVVVDDAFQHVTHVVRGADLLDNTPRQIALQQALGLPTPRYLHVPLVLDACGRKLSKQTQAPAIDPRNALAELELAWQHLGFSPTGASSVRAFQQQALTRWRDQWCVAAAPRSIDAPPKSQASA